MARSSRAAAGVAHSVTLGSVTIATNVLLLPLVLSTVGASSYGLWLFVLSVASFATFADLGVSSAVVHYSAPARVRAHRPHYEGVLQAAALISCLAALIVAPATYAVATLYLDSEGLQGSVLPVLAATVAAGVGFKPGLALLQSDGRYLVERRLQLLNPVLRIIGTVLVCIWVPKIEAIALVETVAILVPSLAGSALVPWKRLLRRTPWRVLKVALATLVGYGTRALSVALVGTALMQGGTIIVGIRGTPADVTYWNAAFRVYLAARQANGWVVLPFLPVLTRLFRNQRTAAMSIVEGVTSASVLTTILGVGAFIPISFLVVGIWLGPAVPGAEVAITISVLLIGLVLNSVHGPLSMIAEAARRPGLFLPPQVFWLLALVVSGLPLFSMAGIVGVAVALSWPLLVVEPWYLVRARSALGIPLRGWWANCFRPGILVGGCGAVAAVGMYVANPWANTPAGAILTSASFVAGFAAASVLSRKLLPLAAIRHALRAEL
ncbi:lipopolysaccharide biosynthesis protein [Agromyces sp. MMS24-K17]|uniref:lipopolysaccharide biosynthesis protein n=1 Tax=Agromyces sp. MMS24-K17 TaxID=3372850 RepID=UPI0037551D56